MSVLMCNKWDHQNEFLLKQANDNSWGGFNSNVGSLVTIYKKKWNTCL